MQSVACSRSLANVAVLAIIKGHFNQVIHLEEKNDTKFTCPRVGICPTVSPQQRSAAEAAETVAVERWMMIGRDLAGQKSLGSRLGDQFVSRSRSNILAVTLAIRPVVLQPFWPNFDN